MNSRNLPLQTSIEIGDLDDLFQTAVQDDLFSRSFKDSLHEYFINTCSFPGPSVNSLISIVFQYRDGLVTWLFKPNFGNLPLLLWLQKLVWFFGLILASFEILVKFHSILFKLDYIFNLICVQSLKYCGTIEI